MQKWHTLLELKETHKKLGLKGTIFFIVDFPMDIETDELKYMIANPTFTGLGVGTGLFSFVLSEEKINELFIVIDKTFNEHANELEEYYFSNK